MNMNLMSQKLTVKPMPIFRNGSRICRHCNGQLRFYRSELTCLMCGRNVDHFCKDCMHTKDLLVETA